MFIDMLIGGFAGINSRTITAPLELYKIQRQNAFMPHATLRAVIKKEGLRYLWKGNATNCMRVFPQTALNYSIFNFCKNNVFSDISNNALKNFCSGTMGGGVSTLCTYPLETIRSRLSLQTSKSHYKGFLHACKTIPFLDLYKGLRMSIMGFAPFSAIKFMLYFDYKDRLEKHTTLDTNMVNILGGGLAGITAITITYPTDLIRRRLQLQNFDTHVPRYTGILDCISKIYQTEGMRGWYRGLSASYIKLFPTIGIQFLTIEKLNEILK